MKLQIVRAPARNGVQWLKLSFQTFWRQPLALTALFCLAWACFLLIAFIPLVGPILSMGLLPCFTLAVMVATAKVCEGHTPASALLSTAFGAVRKRLRAMLTLGALYIASQLLILGLMVLMIALIVFGDFASFSLTSALDGTIPRSQIFLWSILPASVLTILQSLLFWHAPGLVHWHGISPVKAMFLSAASCLRNWRAFVLCGLIWISIFLLLILLLILGVEIHLVLIGVATSMTTIGLAIAVSIAAATLTMALHMSVVFTFRDCFSAPAAPPTDPTPTDVNAA